MAFDLINAISNNQDLLSLMDEPESIAYEREMTGKSVDVLKKAIKVIRRDPEYILADFLLLISSVIFE